MDLTYGKIFKKGLEIELNTLVFLKKNLKCKHLKLKNKVFVYKKLPVNKISEKKSPLMIFCL